jgi:6-bladed beta-propeller/NHL repeat
MKFPACTALAIFLAAGSIAAPAAKAQSYLGSFAAATLSGPDGIAIDTANGGNVISPVNLFGSSFPPPGVAEIAVFSPTGQKIATFGSYGSGDGQLAFASAVAVDIGNASNIVVADTNNNRIEVFSASGNFIRTIGSAGSGDGQLTKPGGVAVDPAHGGNVLVADTGNSRIEVFDATGTFIRTIGGNGQLNSPTGVAIDTANGGNVLVADTGNNRIEVFDATGTFIRTIGSTGSGNGQLDKPTGVAVDTANGSAVVVADNGNARIEIFSATGSFINAFSSFGDGHGQFTTPYAVAIDTAHGGNLLVADDLFIDVFANSNAVSPLAAAILPGGRAVQINRPATVFATMLNSSDAPLQGCEIGLLSPGPSFDYQTTDPATNAVTGQPNTPVTIAAKGGQTFLLTATMSDAVTLTGFPLLFDCAGVAPAPVVPGVDTIDLTVSTARTADIIVAVATASGDGILDIPFSTGQSAAFALATANAGADSSGLVVSVDTGTASLPLTLSICQTNPANGQCLAPPVASMPVAIAAGAEPTFSIFATASGSIPFAPGTSRIFVRFLDGNGTHLGSASVAVRTQ